MMRVTIDGIDEAIIFDSENQSVTVVDYFGSIKFSCELSALKTNALCALLHPFSELLGEIRNDHFNECGHERSKRDAWN